MEHELFAYLSKHDIVAAACVAGMVSVFASAVALLKVMDEHQAREDAKEEKRIQDAKEQKKEAEAAAMTEKAEAQAVVSLQESILVVNQQAREKVILDAVLIPVIVANAELMIEKFPDPACAMFGWTEREILGKSVSLLIPNDLKPAHFAGVARYQKTGQSSVIGRTVQVRGLHKDGRTFPLALSLSEGMNADGTPFYVALLSPHGPPLEK